MLDITLSPHTEAAFLAHICRYTDHPVFLRRYEKRLLAEDLSPGAAGRAAAYAAFPCREARLLRQKISRLCRGEDIIRQRVLAALAVSAAEEDIPAAPLYQGPGRLERLCGEFTSLLTAGGRLDMEGFCRFRLPGYGDYLTELVERAEEELAKRDEEERYYRLLSGSLSAGRGSVALFFSEDGVCSVWQNGAAGIRHVEGGRVRGTEWLVAANLIAMDPGQVELKRSEYAPPLLVEMLRRIFGEKLTT